MAVAGGGGVRSNGRQWHKNSKKCLNGQSKNAKRELGGF
jgi:hypothetical protein